MEEFNRKTSVLVYRAIGKKIDETIDSVEAEELGNHYEKILTDLSWIACKELEAYLVINLCRGYDQLAQLIMKREKKNKGSIDYDKLLGRLRTRAHRGRKKVLDRIEKMYTTAK